VYFREQAEDAFTAFDVMILRDEEIKEGRRIIVILSKFGWFVFNEEDQ
jgi:hypothetical protein